MHRILSGMRPTGLLHFGNYIGALKQWVELQNSGEYECFYMVADLHALTTEYQNPKNLKEYTLQILIDWISVGLDPNKSVLFVQSLVPEHAELYTLLGMITPISWLERNPTYKDMIQELKDKDIANYGFLGYPVLQAADILIYKADRVPVGKDQLPHLELSREIARRFNYLYGEVFPEPQAILGEVPHIYGIDGRKMSKSYNNAIYLSDPEEEMRKKISMMFTDPQRIKKEIPGRPEECRTFPLYMAFASKELQKEVEEKCKKAEIGCVQCKKQLADVVIEYFKEYRKRRKELEQDKEEVWKIAKEGSEKAREVASQTLQEVKKAMGIKYF